MACYLNENVYTHTFTPREYQVELLDSAKKRNTIVCSSASSAKAFITIKLLQEFSHKMRVPHGKQALFVLDGPNVPIMTSHVKLLTDLTVTSIDKEENPPSLKASNVIVTTAEVCVLLCKKNFVHLDSYALIVIDCLYGGQQSLVREIMARYQAIQAPRPRILGLTAGLLGSEMQPDRLEAELQRLEKLLSSSVDTSSEILTLIRLSCRPRERIVECFKPIPSPLQDKIKATITSCQDFLKDHRYDPSEIYDDDLLEEFKQVPDPKEQPLSFFDDFLEILDDLGPWSADRAAYGMLIKIEKLKVKVPYERHYLLLCVASSVLVSIRALCELEFQDYTDKEKVFRFSTPKVLRFLQVLKQFKPTGDKPETCDKLPDLKDPKKGKGKNYKGPRRPYISRAQSDEMLCALVFVKNRYKAEALFALLCVMSKSDEEYWWVSVSFSVNKIADPVREPREAESEHKRQEEVLRKYRSHECNIMIATSALEQGCDLPKCNLVIRFDLPQSFHSYIHSKARARANEAHFLLLANENEVSDFVENLAEYNEVENTLLKRCYSLEPDKNEELVADASSLQCRPYQPSAEPGANSVSLSNAIALVNRYCAKLPSDTFTRLTPIWHEEKVENGYICSIRLPINSPVKKTVTSPPMINTLLARRAAAFMICQLLHKAGELDDNLQPIGKENFKVNEEDWNSSALEESDEENLDPRPGTTKRRQYYYKKVADALLDCHPIIGQPTYFYKIVMKLTCPLPEEQNTRGRKIYPPEDSPQGFGILTSKEIPKISAFPIFTRSGEVSVDLQLCSQLIVTENQICKIREFLNYTFTSVLRLQKYLTLFNPDASANSYLIVPTIDGATTTVDWDFIDLIYANLTVLPEIIPEEVRKSYEFDPEKYRDAVVMPWYRNQDQPQYFYVAEICSNLNPASDFPGSDYATFEEYYLRKYSIQIQNKSQHLLDVDHTSARLNFLTPRYVNRKGVALPTSSEATKRAKREKLEQKQILVPELCAIHPFSASLWRKAVCLPCILYRINALLLADQIRRTVALELNLGKIELDSEFKWPPLNFGWSLADVLKKSKDEEKKKQEKIEPVIEEIPCTEIAKIEDFDQDDDEEEMIEIGTWSNDMAQLNSDQEFPVVRYASPTSWMDLQNTYDDSSFSDSDYSGDESESEWGGLRIEFTGDNVAEAVDDENKKDDDFELVDYSNVWKVEDESEITQTLRKQFHDACARNKDHILSSGILVSKSEQFQKCSDCDNTTTKDSQVANSYDFDFGKLFIELDQHKALQIDLAPQDARNEYDISETMTFKFDEQPNLVEHPGPSPNALQIDLAPQDARNEYDISETMTFKFDEQPNLVEHPGPSPNVLLQALTMSNANDGINLERLETIGDSFLKYAITNYLYSKYENVHEGKLSHLRSKQVSNLNLYRLGRRKGLGEYMIATKFDPHDNWLPPCFYVPKELEEALIDAQFPANCWTVADMAATRDMTLDDICSMVRQRGESLSLSNIIPYNLVTQHSIPDKSIADCVEALIGAYLIECGPRGALLFMAWLGIRVLPQLEDGTYGEIELPKSPLSNHLTYPREELDMLLDGYDQFERHIGYKFRDRSYLLQALTHASFSPNTLTDCYQRLEFLGDAVLDYLITRHLYEDTRMHSPGALTDLRSALVNNTIFASLAVRNGFHRYFRNLSPSLNEVVEKFVRLQEDSGHTLVDELYLVVETEEVEDVEVPKALGDVFESVAGAIFLDSGMSLDAVWKVYYNMMKSEIEQFSNKVPKSPIRELLELEPETAKFGKPEKLADGRRVRVTVEVFGKGVFKGIGRNYRIAKCTAAKCALKNLKKRGLIKKIDES
ncbi:dicer-1 [Tribolium castaneum]|uniref:ribonuclease III n=2 Tax=Tribolium castaneum TaxID=7070 RepID=D6W8B0_TRICA|nr:dicer-1 [Tribolium castaneum]